jgi:hypothetical protein
MSDFKKQSVLIDSWSKNTAQSRQANEDAQGSFDLRDTLNATEVREMSFAEFRAALQRPARSAA